MVLSPVCPERPARVPNSDDRRAGRAADARALRRAAAVAGSQDFSGIASHAKA
jgi:hypothetical protein